MNVRGIAGTTAGTAIAAGVAVLITSSGAALVGIGAEPLEAKAATVQLQDPPCGYDVYRGKVYVTSLGTAHGTARVIRWSGQIGTLVGTKHIDRGQSITIRPSERVKANRVTVDIVRGKLTKNEGNKKVWHCEAA